MSWSQVCWGIEGVRDERGYIYSEKHVTLKDMKPSIRKTE